MRYSLSKKIRFLEVDNQIIAYNTTYGNLTILTPDQYKFLLNFKEASLSSSTENLQLLKTLIKLKYITPNIDEDLSLRKKRDIFLSPSNSISNFKGIILRITNECNFSCKYCVDKAGDLQKGSMKTEMAIRAIDIFLDFCKRYKKIDVGKVSIGFNGGEPLLGFHLVKECTGFIKEKYGAAPIDFDINTNASLIDKEIALYLKTNNFSIKTSLDGFKVYNDEQRQSKSRNLSAFERTLGGIYNLKKVNYTANVSVIAVITENSINGLDRSFLEFIRNDLDVRHLVIEPDILNAFTITPRELASKIFSIKKISDILGGINVSGQWCIPFLNLIKANPYDIPSFCSSMSGLSFNIFPNGDIRSCNYLNNEYTLANIKNISQFEEIFEQKSFKDIIYKNFGGLKSDCKDCHINGLCKGDCFVISAHARKTKNNKFKEYHCSFMREITDFLIRDFVRNCN